MRNFLLRAVAWPLAVLTAGCLGPVAHDGAVFRHREHGYAVFAPGTPSGVSTPGAVSSERAAASAPGSEWKRVEVPGATLAFRGSRADTMMVKSRCGKPLANVQLMARHLLIGLPDREVVEAHPVEIAGESGWLQVVDTLNEGRPVRLKTVTLIARRCSFDLVLAASSTRFAQVEPVFDAWWQGFHFVTSDPEA